MKMYEDYKLRVDKAIEYIENHNKLEKELGGTIRFDIVKLSNILKGDDKE